MGARIPQRSLWWRETPGVRRAFPPYERGLGGSESSVAKILQLSLRWRDTPGIRRAFPPYKLGCRTAWNRQIQKIRF